MKRKWVLIIGLILLLFTAAWVYYLYQKPRADVAAIKADYSITAEKLYNDFATNEAEADKKYSGKVIEVTGIVADVQVSDSAVIVLLAAGNETSGINCSFKNTNVALTGKGKTVEVKGRCTGFLMDVNLVDAGFVE